jgi:hypothetical protein
MVAAGDGGQQCAGAKDEDGKLAPAWKKQFDLQLGIS